MSFVEYKGNNKVQVSVSPFIKVLVDKLRRKDTTSGDYFSLTKKICYYLTFQALENLSTKKVSITNWQNLDFKASVSNEQFVIVPVLRAGIAMLYGVEELLEDYCEVSFMGYERNEKTLIARENYRKISNKIADKTAIILDPMLATGGTLEKCIDLLKKFKCKKIISLSIISAPEGIKKVIAKHKDVFIYTAQLDEKLNENGFIMPGLGDFGDRTFGGCADLTQDEK